ncbi:MAG: RluA family pseudouridine synthase [Clostridia bacterium]|nr:RluA family pseudouridine synthase [Clostridia bacterium]
MKEFMIGKNDAGQRLDRFVGKTVPLLPASLAQKYIRIKRIKVNGKGAKRDCKLELGDSVQMYVNDEFFEVPSEENAYLMITDPVLDIVYEDDNIMLVNKPSGMLCHPDGKWSYNTLISHIQAYLYAKRQWRPREENAFAPALCNRIDRNTSGIVIAAKNAEAMRIINEKIRSREIDKYYLTVVHGVPGKKHGMLEGYLFKDAKQNRVYVRKQPEPGARTAVTEYTVLRSKDGLSLLECRLHTGRTHQIRAQLADAGFPLLGDGKYGTKKRNDRYGETSQLLCSYKLVFSFESDAGALNYLNGREFSVDRVDFVSKYFG